MSLSNSFLQQSQIIETHRVRSIISFSVFRTTTSNKSDNQALHLIAALPVSFALCSNPLRAMFHPCVYSFWVPLADVTVSISRVLTDLIRCTGGARMHIFIIIAINGVLDCKCTIRECPAAKAACPGVEYQPRLKFFIRFLPINRRKIVPRRIFTKLYGQVFIASHKFLLVDKSHNQRVKRTRNSRAAYPCRYPLQFSFQLAVAGNKLELPA